MFLECQTNKLALGSHKNRPEISVVAYYKKDKYCSQCPDRLIQYFNKIAQFSEHNRIIYYL